LLDRDVVAITALPAEIPLRGIEQELAMRG
jgi:hypothetical protein